MTCTNLLSALSWGHGPSAVAGGGREVMGQGLAPCPFASEGLVEGNPAQLQLLRGAPGRGGLALGHCCCSRLQALSQPSRRRKPYPLQVPCSHHGASCLNLVPAPCTPPCFSLREGPPQALAGVGQRQALAWRGRSPGSWSPSSSAARGANSPPALQTSLLAQKVVPVPFIFLYGDVTSVLVRRDHLGGGWCWSCKPGGASVCSSWIFLGGWDRPLPP